jgi:hypothetical protein
MFEPKDYDLNKHSSGPLDNAVQETSDRGLGLVDME